MPQTAALGFLPLISQLNLRILHMLVLAMSITSSAWALDVGKKKAERNSAIQQIPLQRLTPNARRGVERILSRPTMFRRLPTQAMDCDQDMFLFLVRHPEVLVGIWDVMDITQVKMQRTGPFTLSASDGQGTTCEIELVYGDAQTHLFLARGKYDGPMVAKPITGSGVFVLHSSYARSSRDRMTIAGQMDVFLQLDSLGADLVVRTLGPLIGKSADHNFVETAKFITQISQASEVNPDGVRRLGKKLPQVNDQIKAEFIAKAVEVAERSDAQYARPLASRTSPAPAASASFFESSPRPGASTPAKTQEDLALGQDPIRPLKDGMKLRR